MAAITAIVPPGTLQVRLVATPYYPRVSLGTRLGASDFVAADAGPEAGVPSKPAFLACLGGLTVGEPHQRGAYPGNTSTPRDTGHFLSSSLAFQCCRLPGGRPDILR